MWRTINSSYKCGGYCIPLVGELELSLLGWCKSSAEVQCALVVGGAAIHGGTLGLEVKFVHTEVVVEQLLVTVIAQGSQWGGGQTEGCCHLILIISLFPKSHNIFHELLINLNHSIEYRPKQGTGTLGTSRAIQHCIL